MFKRYTKSLPTLKALFALLFIASGFNCIAQPDNWVKKSDLGYDTSNVIVPRIRYSAVSFSIGNKGYLGTGYSPVESSADELKDFWEYDPELNSWTQKANFGGGYRYSAVGFSIGSKGYIGTGYYVARKKDFWEYDPVNNLWTQKKDFEGDERSSAIGFSIGNYGYIGTGVGDFSDDTKDFWRYDPISDEWTQKADFGGSARHKAVGFCIGTKGYIGTGYSYEISGYYQKDFWEYDPDLDTWTPKASFGGTARYAAVGFSANGYGYIGTGEDEDKKNDFWEYDPSLDTWNQKPDFPGVPRGQATGFSLNNEGYLGTGESGGTSKDFWKYDPQSNIWTKKADFGGTQRHDAVGFNIGNKGYIGTGHVDSKPYYSSEFWEYDPVLNTWTQKADLPVGRQSSVGFSIGAKGYIGTGLNFELADEYLKDFWEYDPLSNAWTQKEEFGGSARSEAVGFSIGGKGYIGTGYVFGQGRVKDFWQYDPATDVWTQKEDFGGIIRSNAIGFGIGDKGYLGTGYNSTEVYLKDFWEYDPNNDNWSQKADFAGTARCDAVGFSIENKGFLGTGYDDNFWEEITKDFWEYDPDLDTWTQKKDFGGGYRFEAVGFSIGSKGYLGTGSLYSYDEEYDSKSFWEYTLCYGMTLYADSDNDGFGDVTNTFFAPDCVLPANYVVDSTDCNDSSANIFPGAQEILFNGLDDNCDGYIDEFGTGIEELNSTSFFTIFPNPASNQTTIQFTLPHSSQVSVAVFDMSGKKINTLIDDELKQGDHSLQFNTTQFSKGIYLVRMINNEGMQNQKLIIQ